ncbi:hypothetical protein GALLN_00545 [Gallionellaceae bacterium]|nr:hypothetical protein GALLN_00545 [Gallionellaceae bacterium]
MKLRNLALAFATTVLLPPIAYADDNIDAIRASFDRDFNREFAVRYAPVTGADADPLDAINIALRTESDQTDESTERNICRKPAAFRTAAASGEADPLDVIYVVLRCKKTDMTNSNLKHSLNQCKPIYCSVS